MLSRTVIQYLNSEKNNFSQYGGWIVEGYKGKHTMYTRDREGIVDDIPHPGQKPDVQAASCTKHILFGHGPYLQDFRSKEFRTIHNLGIDNKIKSKVFLDPHFEPEGYMSQTQSSFHKPGSVASQTAAQTLQASKSATNWFRPGTGGASAGISLAPPHRQGNLVNSVAIGSNQATSQAELNGYHTSTRSKPFDPNIERYGEVDTLKHNRRTGDFKFYDDYTKRFDQTHNKTKLRDPY